MLTPNLTSTLAVTALFATSLVPTTVVEGSDGGEDTPAPVQVLQLTDGSGEPTSVATAALEEVNLGNGGVARNAIARGLLSSTGEDSLDATEDAAILTQPLEVAPFMVTGLTWTLGEELPEGSDIFIRVREGGQWSDWYLTEYEDGAGRDDGVGTATGTEPFVTSGADAIQVRVTGDVTALPTGLALSLIPATPSGEEVITEEDVTEVAAEGTPVDPDSLAEPASSGGVATFGDAILDDEGTGVGSGAKATAASYSTATPRSAYSNTKVFAASSENLVPVNVITRAEWGADESKMSWTPKAASASFVVVHHTAGSNDYTQDQAASVVRGIYAYHSTSLGWGDIGYNFLVDKWGRVYEGRKGSLASAAGQMVSGAHAAGYNTGSMGISMMGNYTSVAPSAATLDSVAKMAAWQLKRAGVDPASSANFNGKVVNRILGHRDVNATACPGNMGYAQLGAIRATASSSSGTSFQEGWVGLVTPSGESEWRYYGADGKLKTGWLFDDNEWYYLDASGLMLTGWQFINAQWYYLKYTGEMQTGLINLGNSAYYLAPSGEMQTGWITVSESRKMWASSSGELASGWARIGTSWYYFNASFAMQTGWLETGGSRYWLSPSGAMATAVQNISGLTYAFSASGSLGNGWTNGGSAWYWTDSSGHPFTGWRFIDETWYYFDTNYAMHAGWLQTPKGWYWFNPSGMMSTGMQTVNSKRFYFNSDGLMKTGWFQVGTTWHWAAADGPLATGWQAIAGSWYYFNPDTSMRTGWVKDGQYWYWLDFNGAMTVGSRTIDGSLHSFNSMGQWLPTSASSGSSTSFTAGYIISDDRMFTSHSMTAAQVQQFLTEKNPSCTPASDGTPCLANYRTTTQTLYSPYCETYIGAPNESAASIIAKSARACGLNAQVLLVMLQKEQSLVTASGNALKSSDSSLSRYDKALGFACPDSASCNPKFRGFANQVYYAAARLVEYGERPSAFRFSAGNTYAIAYNPNASCGSANVYIHNRATAALYNYTPYQPNAAALANMRGVGDSCSTYGNRNFWRLFTDWFGDPRY